MELGIGIVVLGLIGYPLARLGWSSFVGSSGLSLGGWGQLATGQFAIAIIHTVLVSAAATVVAVGLGTAMALLSTRSDLPGRRLFGVLWVAPLLIPAYVTGLAWTGAYFRGGLSDEWFAVSFGWLEGPVGLGLLLALQGSPLAYLLIRSNLSGQRIAELEDAARSAGASSLRALHDVTLPLLRPVIGAAVLLVFVMAASDFGIPAILGIPAGFSMVTTLIYAQLSFAGGQHAIASATALSAFLGALGLAVVLALTRLSRQSEASARNLRSRSTMAAPLVHLGALRWLALSACVAFSALSVGLPLLALVLEALSSGFTMSLSPFNWTASNFASALSGADLASLGRSVGLAAAAALVVSLGGATVAVTARRGRRVTKALAGLTALPFTLPGSVVAVAVLLAWQRWFYGSLAIILLAYLARFAVIGVRAADASLSSMPSELVDAGRAAGARPARVALDVVRPALAPGMLAGFALVFLLCVHELTISSLLYAPSTETFAVQVLNAEQGGDLALTAALAVVVTALTVLVASALFATRRGRQLVGGGRAE